MSQTLHLNNFDDPNIGEISKLGADVQPGDLTLQLNYTDDYEPHDFIYLSELSSESGEIVTVDAVTNATSLSLLTPGARKTHATYEKVTRIFGDQIKIYRALNVNGTQPADGVFEYLDTINIDFDQPSTAYIDDSANPGDFWYKYIFLNSFNGEETNLADSSASRGGGIGNYCSVQTIKQVAGLTGNRYIAESIYDTCRKAAQDEVNGALYGLYTIPFSNPVPAKIADITSRLAAGLLLTGPIAAQYTTLQTKGEKLRDDARADLEKIKQRATPLIDATGTSLQLEASSGFQALPNEDTDGLDWSQGGRAFTTQDRY
jgi:hypothetical protein